MINKKVIKLISLFCLTSILLVGLMVGCISFVRRERYRNLAQSEYKKFLAGESSAILETSAVFQTKEVQSLKDMFERDDIEYLFCDIDSDGLLELHVRSTRFYYILKYKEKTLKIIFADVAYVYPINNNKLCGILYYRKESAPENEVYCFTIFDKNGEHISGPEYIWYDMNENYKQDENDLYMSDDTEQDMRTWLNETEVYRENMNQQLEWMSIE